MNHMGRTIAGTRELLGYDQGDLAAEIAARGTLMSARTLGRIERGEREPRAGEIAIISEVLGVPVSWFYEGPEWLATANTKGPDGGPSGPPVTRRYPPQRPDGPDGAVARIFRPQFTSVVEPALSATDAA